MDDDLKAVVVRLEEKLAYADEVSGSYSDCILTSDLRTLLSALRQRDEVLRPFAAIAHGEVWEKFIADSRSTLRISNGAGDKHLCFINAECFQSARAILTGSETNAR